MIGGISEPNDRFVSVLCFGHNWFETLISILFISFVYYRCA